jgi:antitoxin CptB
MLTCGDFPRNAGLCKARADITRQALYINPARPRPGFWRWSNAVSTGTNLSSDGMDARRRRLLFRCWHRGIREMDLVLGRFADTQLEQLNETELDEVERWLDVPDQQIFAWVNGMEPTPAEFDTALFRRLSEFSNKGDT